MNLWDPMGLYRIKTNYESYRTTFLAPSLPTLKDSNHIPEAGEHSRGYLHVA
jgi:hypothetical protein